MFNRNLKFLDLSYIYLIANTNNWKYILTNILIYTHYCIYMLNSNLKFLDLSNEVNLEEKRPTIEAKETYYYLLLIDGSGLKLGLW
jgi:hypothetical protein